jgi:hypothetical protein
MHEPLGAAWLIWLETSAYAAAMRQWLWLYPIVEIVHILGFVVLVGAAALFDLRLLGVSRTLPVSALAAHLLPWSRAGLLLVAPSGLSMFVAHATEMATNPAFQLKLVLIAAAGLNAYLFHRGVFLSVAAWDRGLTTPVRARAAGLVSLACWTGVLTCGRLLAYL